MTHFKKSFMICLEDEDFGAPELFLPKIGD